MLLIANKRIKKKLYEYIECIRHCAKDLIGEKKTWLLPCGNQGINNRTVMRIMKEKHQVL